MLQLASYQNSIVGPGMGTLRSVLTLRMYNEVCMYCDIAIAHVQSASTFLSCSINGGGQRMGRDNLYGNYTETAILFQIALKALDRRVDANKPFLLSVQVNAPVR